MDLQKDIQNVYQSTQMEVGNHDDFDDEVSLASAGKRILAYLINCLIGAIAYIPIIWGAMEIVSSAALNLENPNTEAALNDFQFNGFGMSLIGLGGVLLLAYLIFQAVLMSKTGQSLGKRIMKIKVVDEEGENPGFKGVVLMREIVPNLGLTVIAMIPFIGGLVQFGFWVACLVMLFMVDRDRQTLQDLIAKTYVVDAE